MSSNLQKKYWVKNTSDGSFVDVTYLFEGVNILSVQNFDKRGKAVNVYKEQWVDSQTEDFLITTTDENQNPVIIRENVDLKLVFIVGQRYSSTTIDVQTVYDAFVDYMTNTDIWVGSTYVGKHVHCVCLEGVEPQTVKLQRGGNTYILGEITLHTLEKPSSFTAPTTT